MGAAMSILYSMIAFIASAVKGGSNVSYGKREGSSVDRAFGTFNSFGTIMFAFGGQIIMPEIEVYPVPYSYTHRLAILWWLCVHRVAARFSRDVALACPTVPYNRVQAMPK